MLSRVAPMHDRCAAARGPSRRSADGGLSVFSRVERAGAVGDAEELGLRHAEFGTAAQLLAAHRGGRKELEAHRHRRADLIHVVCPDKKTRCCRRRPGWGWRTLNRPRPAWHSAQAARIASVLAPRTSRPADVFGRLQLELRLDQHQQSSPPLGQQRGSAGSTSVSEMNDRSPTIRSKPSRQQLADAHRAGIDAPMPSPRIRADARVQLRVAHVDATTPAPCAQQHLGEAAGALARRRGSAGPATSSPWPARLRASARRERHPAQLGVVGDADLAASAASSPPCQRRPARRGQRIDSSICAMVWLANDDDIT